MQQIQSRYSDIISEITKLGASIKTQPITASKICLHLILPSLLQQDLGMKGKTVHDLKKEE